jgi:hypothetical protein
MTLSLTCSCGARLEIDAKFACQAIRCPDCDKSLQAPALERRPRRTSGLALASFLLALVGAFTVVGTLLAVGLGALALVDLKRRRDRLSGRAYALAGIVLGVVFTGISLFAYVNFELFGLDSLMREPQWAGKLDYSGPLEVIRSKEGFALARPSEKWGVYEPHNWARTDLLLVNVAEDGYVICWPDRVAPDWPLEGCRKKAVEEFRDGDLVNGPSRTRLTLPTGRFEVAAVKHLPTVNDTEAVEMLIHKSAGNQRRTYLVRVIKKHGASQMYLVAAGTSRQRFGHLESHLRKALESFRLVDLDDRNGP